MAPFPQLGGAFCIYRLGCGEIKFFAMRILHLPLAHWNMVLSAHDIPSSCWSLHSALCILRTGVLFSSCKQAIAHDLLQELRKIRLFWMIAQ